MLKYIPKGQVFRVDAAEGERIAAMSGATMAVKVTDSRLPLGAPLLAALVGALLVGTAALVFFVRSLSQSGETAASPEVENPASTAMDTELRVALDAHRRGDVFKAHEEVVRLANTRPIPEEPHLLLIEIGLGHRHDASGRKRAKRRSPSVSFWQKSPEQPRCLAPNATRRPERWHSCPPRSTKPQRTARYHHPGAPDDGNAAADAGSGAPSPLENAEDVGSLPEEDPGEGGAVKRDTADHAAGGLEPVPVSRPVLVVRQALLSKAVAAVAIALTIGALAERLPFPKLRIFSAPLAAPEDCDAAHRRPEAGEAAGLHRSHQQRLARDAGKSASSHRSEPLRRWRSTARLGSDRDREAARTHAWIEPVEALDGFFAALARTQRKVPGAVTRIAHFGDSVIVSDYVSGTLRRKLQSTFAGDAGHGYMLLANAWPALLSQRRHSLRQRRLPGEVGYRRRADNQGWIAALSGGSRFRASPGVIARYGTAGDGEFGRR